MITGSIGAVSSRTDFNAFVFFPLVLELLARTMCC